MKKNLQNSLLFSFVILFTFFQGELKAQKKLIHYWNFNSGKFVGESGAVSAVDSLVKTSIKADYSDLDTNKAVIRYMPIAGTSPAFSTYWDDLAGSGDTINERPGFGGCCGATNNGLRPRNPTDSMQLLWYMPTTHFNNIVITYETEASSTTSGPHRQNYSYSLDSGATFITTSLPVLFDSAGLAWGKMVVDLSSITAVNNTDKFVFKIVFAAPNSGTSGNNRFDNITMEGDTIIKAQKKLVHYWNFNSTKFVSSPGDAAVSAVNVLGGDSITADYSDLDTNKAVIRYMPIAGTSAAFSTYWDVTTGDTINERPGYGRCCTGTNNSLRPRNPTDSMQLLWYMPTTHFNNIVITYETESSSTTSGPHRQNYSYSLDSGATFITTSLPVLFDSAGLTWGKTIVDLSSITTINNTDKFVFKILFAAPNSGTSGNNRFDNITMEGDTITGGGPAITQSGVILTSSAATGNQWYLNGSAITGATGKTDTIKANGAYSVKVASAFSNTITIVIPATPTITASGTDGAVLTSSSTTGNQWYMNGTAISGATGKTYTVTANGVYTVKVTSTGITAVSATSNVTAIPTGIEPIGSNNTFSVYPNPNGGNFTVMFNESVSANYTLEITDMYGRTVYTETLTDFAGSYSKQINLTGSGVYIVSLTSATGKTVEKVIVY